MIKPLNDAQQKLATDNHHLIYKFLHQHHFPIEEYYGLAAIGLCQAAEAFDPTLGFTFATFAYRCMKMSVLQELRKNNRLGRKLPDTMLSLDFEYEEGLTLYDDVSDPSFSPDDLACAIDVKTLLSGLSVRDRGILLMKMNGADQRKIGAAFGISQAQVSRIVKKAREKYLKGCLA